MGDRVRWGVLIGAAVAAVFAPGASAATINVESDLDTVAADGFCALREAVFVANTNEPTGGRGLGNLGCEADTAGHDTIVLTANHVYVITQGFAIDDSNVWADLDISGPTTITTAGGMATIQGNGTDPQVNERDRVLHVLSTAGSVSLERVKIQGGWVSSGAGGGGILNDAPLTVIDSEITGNRVQSSGATFGGGIYTRGPLGTLTMRGSTVAGNVDQTVDVQAVGGGIAAYLGAPSVSITNSTISGNQAIGVNGVGPGNVGGAFLGDGTINSPASVALTSNTITLNTATQGGALTGGLQLATGSMTGNLVAGNVSDNAPAVDCFGGPATSGGGNLIGDPGTNEYCVVTGPGDLVGTHAAPVLANIGTLVNNGGLTRTHAPNPGSPAINRGGSCPETDQRGLFRYVALPCDAGSVEVGATAVPPTSPPAAPPSPNKKKCKKKKKGKKSAQAAAKKCKKNKKKG